MYDTQWHGVEDEVPEVYPEQTAIPEPTNEEGELGLCYWCSDPAVHGRLDIGLPKRPGQPRTLVQACAFHFRDVVAPALRMREEERQRKLRERKP